MSVSENKALIRRFLEQWNKHDPSLLDEYLDSSIRESLQSHYAAGYAAFPDVHLAFDELIGEGDRVLARYTAQGTFTGPYRDLAPTGRMMAWQGLILYGTANGKITEHISQSNLREVVAQTLEANKALIRRYIEEVVNQGHLERIPEFVAASFVEDRRQVEMSVHRAFPDWHMTIEEMTAEGDLVMKRDTITGTHQGEIMGFAPTGQKLSFSEITVDRVVDGKLVHSRTENDALEVLQKAAAQKKAG